MKEVWEEERPRIKQLLANSFPFLTDRETESILGGTLKTSFQSSQTLLPRPAPVSLDTLTLEVWDQNLITDNSVEKIIENLVTKYS